MSDKPRLTRVTDLDEIDAIRAAGYGIGIPFYHFNQATHQLWADADELRAWRAAQSTSGADK